MAKVYDALKRAEEERKRRAGDSTSPVAPLDAPSTPEPTKRTEQILEKVRPTGRSRESASDVNKRRISMLQPDSYVAEQFRALRARIDAMANQRPLKTIAVCSPLAGDGKTTAAVNLAMVTSLSVDRRVLLIDCDLRKPKVHTALGIRPELGLAEVLTGEATAEKAIMRVEGGSLDVLAVRGRPTNPSELLGSMAMRKLLDELAERYDRIVLDTPAVLGVPDAKAVAEISDGIVMVVRADSTAQHDIEAALEILDRGKILGMVLNGVRVERGRYGYSS
jgi:capsular exopolysaccharide synthesis family protein